MSREKSLAKNTAVISLGTLFPKLITILLLPILTDKLSNIEYGQYDLVITIVSLLLPAVTLQISSAAFRFLLEVREDVEECKKIISTILVFVVTVSVFVGSVYFFVIQNYLNNCAVSASLYLTFDILLITCQQIMRGIGKNLIYAFSCMIRSFTDIFFVVILLGVVGGENFGLNGVMISLAVACITTTLFLFFIGKIYQYFSFRYVSLLLLKQMLNYSWPMVPNNLSGWVLRLSDRVIITAVVGIEANSIYAVATKMPTIFSSVQDTFSMAWQENAALASKDDDKDLYFTQMFDEVLNLLTGLMAVLIMCTPIIWSLLIRGEYSESYNQLPLLYLGIYFSSLSLTIGGIYIAYMKTKNVGITTMIAAIINVMVDLLLINQYGIYAGSISTMVSYFFLLVYRMVDVQRFQYINFKIKKMIFAIFFLCIMGALLFQQNTMCNIINIFICMLVLIIFNRHMVHTMAKELYKCKNV